MTKVNSKKVKLNNNGSTFAMTIITIVFISILASVILAAAAGNVVMKQIDYNSKNAFYTAESVVDEIKTGIGKDSMSAMAGSYETVLTNLIKTHETYGYDYMISNDEANALLQQKFMENMTNKVTNNKISFIDDVTEKLDIDITSNPQAMTGAKAYVEAFVNKIEADAEGNQNKYAIIKNIGGVTIIKDSGGITNTIIIDDVVINYKEAKSKDTYFANVTVDLHIEYPNMIVDFSTTERLDTFKTFALVADQNVKIDGSNNDANVSVNAGIYAGADIAVSSGAGTGSLSVGNFVDADGNVTNSNVVARNNLTLTGSESSDADVGRKAKVSLASTYLWVRNIETKVRPGNLNKDITAGVELTIGADCKSFVQDDLNVHGKNSVVSIGGEYYGYSYDGVAAGNDHLQSSAIIVNGAGSTLNLGSETDEAMKLSRLVIGGHSYISYKNGDITDFMTGETLSFKADQEIYLVPTKYIGINYENAVSNPMPLAVWDAIKRAHTESRENDDVNNILTIQDNVTSLDMTNFFAVTDGLLNAENPYTEKQIGSMMYLYLNFKDRASAAKYIERIIANANGDTADVRELHAKLEELTKEQLGQGVTTPGAVNIAADTMYTSGVLMETNGNDLSFTYGGNLGADASDPGLVELSKNGIDYKNRYTIMTTLLCPLSFNGTDGNRYVVDNIEQALIDLKNGFTITDPSVLTATATENIVDWTMVSRKPYNSVGEKELLGHSYSTLKLTKVAINSNYTVPADITGGIIIANGNVTLDHNFTGIIIASGEIIISGNATITTNEKMVESLITWEYKFNESDAVAEKALRPIPFKNYFDAYKSVGADGSEEVKIESLEYDDMISINNWRKYDDSTGA